MGLLQKIFGTHSENELKRIYPIVDEIEALGPQMEQLSDEELKNKNCDKIILTGNLLFCSFSNGFINPCKTFLIPYALYRIALFLS